MEKIHRVWYDMMRRCHNPKAANYRFYGKRGIKVCKRWHSFKFFKKDMEPSYKEGLSLDRTNNDFIYSKRTCRWTTLQEQKINTTRTYKVGQYSLKGVLLKTYSSGSVASRQTGILNDAISRCCNGHRKSAGKFKWKKIRTTKSTINGNRE